MATLYHATGLVLSRRPWREADRAYAVLTPEHGKIDVIGRGASKPLAKLSSHLELCAEVHLLLVQGRTYETVAGAEQIRTFPGIYGNLSTMTLAHQGLHLIDLGTRERQADPKLYARALEWLAFVETAGPCRAERAAFLLAAFALKLLDLLGYCPELSHCLGCRTAVLPDAYRWHPLKGGIVCDACLRRFPQEWFAARPLPNEALKLVRFGIQEPFSDLLRLHLPGPLLPPFHEAVESLMAAHFPTIPALSLHEACAAC
ncbi:DNA repair protein RecO [Candidatus Uhrbacteria bacterium]|nr:DNA repair protein RecO [Candidatus Uhrbacteria bacterium]